MSDAVARAVAAFAAGEFVLVVDDEDRENEGDLILAANAATPEKIAFMVRHTSGLICVPLEPLRLDELALPLMVQQNTESFSTAFTVSVDLIHDTSTGISAADRATTIAALANPRYGSMDFARPGHIFPLRYTQGGVLARPGHTEAAIDLCRLAGLPRAGVLCELVEDDGTMMRGRRLVEFAAAHDMPVLSIRELVTYRWATEAVVRREAEARLPTEDGEFRAIGYRSKLDGSEHIALVMGEVAGEERVLTRVHSECFTGDVLGSQRCDCRAQLHAAMRRIAAEGQGIIVYNRSHEGRGIGLLNKLSAYRLQDEGHDTVEANHALGFDADLRSFALDAQVLADLKVASVRLLTNNPEKQQQLEMYGIPVAERIDHVVGVGPHNIQYLETKRSKLGHVIGGAGT
ncbi:MAG TPA: bifunctional 3,4-dihydroxy-2-butanone-4-phosphate synthase/GTP cyclohydrolase II [Acidimicrobiia bacterium]|jgi:3,4-dihydroxy 2-butanone 4-phosphate synthase/GTP cyclohydrolase II|nr:bifunctional 3,4-dihydroxy-2-butanone-4-phosphate synthase/GTP cyclohydrolase II [Acidimicrobiia bacterium]